MSYQQATRPGLGEERSRDEVRLMREAFGVRQIQFGHLEAGSGGMREAFRKV